MIQEIRSGRLNFLPTCRAGFLMIPGELDEGIEEIVRDLEVARVHLCSNLLVLHGTHVFLHVTQELLADTDALTQLLNLFLYDGCHTACMTRVCHYV